MADAGAPYEQAVPDPDSRFDDDEEAIAVGWGQPPGDVLAAETARREAIERAQNAPMSPYERKMIGVLEDIRDRLTPSPPLRAITGTVETGLLSVDALLDAPPAELTRSVRAGALALRGLVVPADDKYDAGWFEKAAEAVLEAAMAQAMQHRPTSGSHRETPARPPAAGPQTPPATATDDT